MKSKGRQTASLSTAACARVLWAFIVRRIVQEPAFAPEETAGISPDGGKQAKGGARSESPKKSKKRTFILPILLIVMGCAVFSFAAWSASASPQKSET